MDIARIILIEIWNINIENNILYHKKLELKNIATYFFVVYEIGE